MPKLSYSQTLDYLFARLPMFQRIGAAAFKKDLTNTLRLCAELGNPQDSYESVHIAGTNGKGSTSHLIASMLQEDGKKVGLYTSPHYKDFRERVRVNGQMMSEAFVVDFVERMRPVIEEIEPSFFEITVAMAFDYFRQEGVDIAVVEVGMGGRLDSTNVLQRVRLSIVTNIDLDHQQFLGETRREIAGEKAGIFKRGVPAIVGERHVETDAVFEQRAQELGTGVVFVQDFVQLRQVQVDYEAGMATYEAYSKRPNRSGQPRFDSPLLGAYQTKNIATAVLALGLILPISAAAQQAAQRGIANVVRNTGIMGRWQILQNSPFLVIADAGHNEQGIGEVRRGIEKIGCDQLFFVFGMVRDKAAEKLLAKLPKTQAQYYFCAANIPRARPADELQTEANFRFGLAGEHYASVRDAYAQALADAAAYKKANPDKKPLVFVGGSIFVIAEIL